MVKKKAGPLTLKIRDLEQQIKELREQLENKIQKTVRKVVVRESLPSCHGMNGNGRTGHC